MSSSVESLSVRDIEFVAAPPVSDDGYYAYRERGGSLSETRHAELLAKLNTSPEEASSSQKLQASFMAQRAGFELTSGEESLYGSLRSITNNEGGFLPLGVYDQGVLKEACLIKGNIGAVKKLNEAFPYTISSKTVEKI